MRVVVITNEKLGIEDMRLTCPVKYHGVAAERHLYSWEDVSQTTLLDENVLLIVEYALDKQEKVLIPRDVIYSFDTYDC